MPYREALWLALATIRGAKLRSFFTLLGIIVSVAFLVTVVAIIQGMNLYVKVNLTDAMIGTNAFQVRRTPISIGLIDDEELRRLNLRPIVSQADGDAVARALPDAEAVAMQSGWPPQVATVVYKNNSLGNVSVFGVTPPYQIVQDYTFAAGQPLADPDVRDRRQVVVVGYDIADKLFASPETAVGSKIRISGAEFTIKGVIASKGKTLGQSFDAFVLMPFSTFEAIYGRRRTTVVSVKMRSASQIAGAMDRAEEAMRVAHQLRPEQPDDFTVDKADALVAFWKQLTALLFAVIPAVVGIGVVVGGIVIMNIMLMSVSERTREIGIRKAIGANQRDIRRQFLVETVILSSLGGLLGVAAGWTLARIVDAISPLPAHVTLWSVGVALALGAGTGIVFGVYPAARAA
ncbi:MAG: ABC transporter permease, partial [Gemmatimonadales bacterium]